MSISNNQIAHIATGIPQPMIVPDNELFRINTIGSYNLIESACKLGIKKIILASSITTYGISYAEGDVDYTYFPIDENHPTEPMDVYGLSKVCMERTAASFSRRFKNVDIYVLRIGAVITPEKYEEKFKAYCDKPEKWKAHGWSYTDARDLGMMCNLAVQADGLGFQVFNAVNDEITNENDTETFLRRVEPRTQIKTAIGKHEAPISNKKIKEMLKFEEEFGWRRVLGKETEEK
jgi:nucleoside-diphosphate-sugar epimerase